jgi:hypothetical protein
MYEDELGSHESLTMWGWLAGWLQEHEDVRAEVLKIVDDEPDDTKASILLRGVLEPRLIAMKRDDDIFSLAIGGGVMDGETEMISVKDVPWRTLANHLRPPWAPKHWRP